MKRSIGATAAHRDLRGTIDHYRGIAPDRPILPVDCIDAATTMLLDAPGMAPPLPDSGSPWRAKGTPFILCYRSASDAIRTVKVRHARPDWKLR